MIRLIRMVVVMGAIASLTGCATYFRDRVRDARDVFSVRAGRMTGIRAQAGPVALGAVKERIPFPLVFGRDAVWQERMDECARVQGVVVPPLFPIPLAVEKELAVGVGFVYRRHSWRRGGNMSRELIRDVTQYEVNGYHRARAMDDLIRLFYQAKRPVENTDASGKPTGVCTSYDHTEIGFRLKTRPMSDIGGEIGLVYGVSVRVNAMEALDFLLGIFCIDILHDDVPSLTPEVIRNKFGITKSHWY